MDRDEESLKRRIRRLKELEKNGLLRAVNGTLADVWREGSKPKTVRLRHSFVIRRPDVVEEPPAAQLLNPRGVALRFYLLALFEAQCRLAPGAEWTGGDRPFRGRRGWNDFIAVDVAYSSTTDTYARAPERTQETKRIRQVKGALLTLEGLGEQALVEIPLKRGGKYRDHQAFRLMNETGRGAAALTPDYYIVPPVDKQMIEIPIDFLLQGWVQVLHPSEIFTWLSFRLLSAHFPARHRLSGNYLYAKKREHFHLLRDSWEDSCQTLVEFGLLRRMPTIAEAAAARATQGIFGSLFPQPGGLGGREDRYEPYRYQLTDKGLAADALETCMKELLIRLKRRGR
ncbi:hypothetical protein [Streptomyces sp. NPDC057429]|uniref:hypothetical protein n=1 Tax=Streptomyces sp. NPDC057429 TaxID=3346130 RepID=UPI0036788295